MVPRYAEQQQIGAFFKQLDHLITLHQRKCVFLFGLFQAFISMIFTASTFSWEQRKVGDLLIERNQQAPMSDEYPLMAFIANEGVAPKGERYDRISLVTDTVNKLYKKTEKGDFTYSDTYKHRMLSATSESSGVKNSFTYDASGNLTSTRVDKSGYAKYIEQGSTYTSNGLDPPFIWTA